MSKQKEVSIQSEYVLSGTLTIPNEERDGYPAVLIIAGSGKSDRDGNNKKIQMNLYKDLADFLTSLRFVTLRYDKRGTYKSEGNFMEAGLSDLITDAVACVKFLQNHPQVDKEKVIILGHSEGAIIAPAVHAKAPVSGIIFVAGAAEPTENLIWRQNEMAFREINNTKGFKGWLFRTLKVAERSRKQNEKYFAKIKQSDKDVMRVRGLKLNAKWIREMLQYNVVHYLEDVDCPVLAITGEKDVQVPPEQAEQIAELVQGDAEWHIIPNLNHILRKYDGEHTMINLIKEYKGLLQEPIDREFLHIIEDWLDKHFGT